MGKEKVECLDIDEGQNWVAPQCIRCEFNIRGNCWKFQKDRLEVPVDIFNCQEFKIKEKKNALPQCINCKFYIGKKCWKLQANLLEISVDIYNCP